MRMRLGSSWETPERLLCDGGCGTLFYRYRSVYLDNKVYITSKDPNELRYYCSNCRIGREIKSGEYTTFEGLLETL